MGLSRALWQAASSMGAEYSRATGSKGLSWSPCSSECVPWGLGVGVGTPLWSQGCGMVALTCLPSSWSSRCASAWACSTSLRLARSSQASFWATARASSRTSTFCSPSSLDLWKLSHGSQAGAPALHPAQRFLVTHPTLA